MLKIVYTLFYLNGCIHCDLFKPEWKKFKDKIKELPKQEIIANSDIEIEVKTHEYEGNEIPPDKAKVDGQEIMGFPTLKVEVDNGNKHREFEYQGKRKADELMDFTFDIIREESKK